MHTASSSVHQPSPSDLTSKRTYLALLPPPQVIEICLTFEAYAPPHVKGLVWPTDLNGAVAALQEQLTSKSAPMDSLADGTGSSKQPETPTVPQSLPSYPHQPYGFPHAQPLYPYAPYPYSLPPGGYPGYHGPIDPHFPAAGMPHPLLAPEHATDDLPSYEEMIVEALKDFNDPEGSQPKNVFTWMAAHYPLQTNFRPSASQALQKAFKRGRLEKGTGGRYKLNTSWEGGNTSRRATRRPQTHTPTTVAGPNLQAQTPSPFTHSPLQRASPSATTPCYPYITGYGHAPTAAASEKEGGEDNNAWEAAESILKAINFGGELKPAEDEAEVAGTCRPGGVERRAELQAQLALLAAQLSEIGGG